MAKRLLTLCFFILVPVLYSLGLTLWHLGHDPQAIQDFHAFLQTRNIKPETLLAALYSVLRQRLEGKVFLDNCYAESVRPTGNAIARKCLADTLDVVDAKWRGIGTIPASGFQLRPALAHLDARCRFEPPAERPLHAEMPPGCDCARVILGKVLPSDCYLYGRACTPRTPIGPCMVSDEGACHVWWTAGVRVNPDAKPPVSAKRVTA